MGSGKNILVQYLERLRLFSRNTRLFLAGEFLIGLGFTSWMLLFNLYMQEAGYDKAAIGDANSVSHVAAAVFAIPFGFMATRLNIKAMLIATSAASPVFYSLAVNAGTTETMYLFIFLATGLFVFQQVAGAPFIMRNTTARERTYVFSSMFMLMLVGGVAGNVGAGLMKKYMHSHGIDPLDGYRWTIMTGMALSMFSVVPFAFMRTSEIKTIGKEEHGEKKPFDWPLFCKAFIPNFMLAVGAGLIVQFLNLYFKDNFASRGVTDADIGFYMSMQSATMAFGVIAAPMIAEKIGKVRSIVTSQMCSIPFMLALALTDNLELAVVAFVVRAALMNMSGPVSNTLVMELCPEKDQGLFSAAFTVNWRLSWAISAFLFGRVLGGDYKASFYTAIGLYIISSLFFYLFFRNAEKDAALKSEAATYMRRSR